jgi:hypothetical protein
MLAGWTLATPFLLLLLPLLTIQEREDRFGMRLAAQLERGSAGLKPNSLSLVLREYIQFRKPQYLHEFL